MNSVIGVMLFAVGVLGAFVSATAWIAYLKTMPVYMGLKKFFRALFSIGVLAIATLVSVLIAQMLMSGYVTDVVDGAAAMAQPATEWVFDNGEVAEGPDIEGQDSDGSSADGSETVDAGAEKQAEETNTKPQKVVTERPSQVESAMVPSFKAWSNIYKGHEYAYIEVENGVPYVYAPYNRGTFWQDLNNINSGRESSNIVVMANAGVFNDDTSPMGVTVQNGKVVTNNSFEDYLSVMAVDEDGNIGYTSGNIVNGTVGYIDGVTGEKILGQRIVSAVTAFSPIVVGGKVMTEYKERISTYSAYRARSIFCVRAKGSYTLITNKGEGADGGGWNFDDMATVALRRGCQFAFNMDGGGSTALAWRTSIYSGFSAYATTERHDPTFIVFTADNLAPSGK